MSDLSDLDALFRVILVNPDEDTPRLVYADALAELGSARRADFIRGQIEGRYREVEGVPLAVGWDFEIRLPYLFFIRNVVELFQTFPITRVVLTDKVPDRVGGYAWFEGDALAETSANHLPSALFRLLGSRVANSRESALRCCPRPASTGAAAGRA